MRSISLAVCLLTLSLLAPPTARATLIGEWLFNEGSGQIAFDTSGSGHNGTLGATPLVDTADPSYISGPSALRFGAGDIVQVTSVPALEPANITIQVTARWPDLVNLPGTFKSLVAKVWSGGPSYGFYTGTTGGIQFIIGFGATNAPFFVTASGGTQYWDNQWHTFVGSYDGAAAKLWVDGSLIATNTFSTTISYNAQPLRIGGFNTGGALTFEGDIDTVRLFDTALTPAQIDALVPEPGSLLLLSLGLGGLTRKREQD